MRSEKISREGKPIGLWFVNIKRQSKDIQRNFYDQTLGGREIALTMAIAWRDAVLRLIPPVTKRQAQISLRSTNTSGVSGVSPVRLKGQPQGWRATLQTPERSYIKTFSFKTYGAHAKELAIAERKRLLEQYGDDAFVTLNKQATQEATQQFGHLLHSSQPTVAPAQIATLVRALNQWFDQLHPGQLFVHAKVYPARDRGTTSVNVRISSARTRNHVLSKRFSLATCSYQQRQPGMWQFIQATITAWHGKDRWQSFAALNESAFMASTAETGFQGRDYGTPLGYPECLTPPALLQPMLAGFELPAVPYLKAQDIPFVAHQSKAAMIPPAAKSHAHFKATSDETVLCH